MDRRVAGERRREGSGVGVVAVQVADQSGDCGALGSRRNHRRQLDLAGPLAERGKCRAGVGERIDHDRGPIELDLHPSPAEPPDLHFSPLFFTGRSYDIIIRVPRRSSAAVAETKAAVTEAAVDRASVEGLEGLTIGGLAGEVEMRKSSVYGLFGSKRELQLATLEAAVEQFTDEVWGPVAEEPPGLTRLRALCDSWLSYHERESLPGGCFLTTASVEFDARPGPLRDAIAKTMERWFGVLEREAAIAIETGELPADTEPADVAFELNAMAAAASYGFQLSRDPEVFARARRSMRRALGSLI